MRHDRRHNLEAWMRFGRRQFRSYGGRAQIEDSVQTAIWAAGHAVQTVAYVVESALDTAPRRHWRDETRRTFEEEFPR